MARKTLGSGSPYLADGLLGLGRLLLAQGKLQAAEPLLVEALEIHLTTALPERIAEVEDELVRCRRELAEPTRLAGRLDG